MSGQEKLTIEELLKLKEKELDDYLVYTKMQSIQGDNEVDYILKFDSANLQQLTEQGCGEAAFLLNRYASFLQKENNYHTAIYDWAYTSLNKMTGKYGSDYGDKYTKWEEKQFRLIAENEAASRLCDIKSASLMKKTSLDFMASRVRDMSNVLVELQKSKRYQNGYASRNN